MGKKILVARLSAIGDVVRTIPAVNAIRKHFKDCTIHWLVEDRCAEMINGLSCIDELKIIPRKMWKKIGFFKQLIEFQKFINQLKKEKYDIFLDFHGIAKSGLYGYFARIPRRIGYPKGISKEGVTIFYNEIINAEEIHISRYERNFLIPLYFDKNAKEEHVTLPINKNDTEFATNFLEKNSLKENSFVFMYPGTSKVGRYKRWMPENFGKLANMIFDKYNLKTIIGWGPGEEELIEEMLKVSKESAIALPLTTMKQLSAVIEKAKLYIGGDTGPTHISSFVKTPLVVILGPSDPVLNQPAYFTSFKIVYAQVDCSPCRNKKCLHLKCLTKISPEMVLKESIEFIFLFF